MNYNLYQPSDKEEPNRGGFESFWKLITIISEKRRKLIIALSAILMNATLSLAGPWLVGYTIDTYIQTKQFHGVLVFSSILLVLYTVAFAVNYTQMRMMGGIGLRMVFRLRRKRVNASSEVDPFAPRNSNMRFLLWGTIQKSEV